MGKELIDATFRMKKTEGGKGWRKEVWPDVHKTSSSKEEFQMRGGLGGQSCSDIWAPREGDECE